VLRNPKKLITAVASWVDGPNKGESGWDIGEDEAEITPTRSSIRAWEYYKMSGGGLPYEGGYLNQPLSLLVQIEAIELIYSTIQFIRTKDSDWTLLTPTQLDIVRYVENS